MKTERTNHFLDGVVDYVLELQLIFVVGVSGGKMSELIGQFEAFINVLRGDEILSHFDAAVEVEHLQHARITTVVCEGGWGAYLVGGAGRNEDTISLAL